MQEVFGRGMEWGVVMKKHSGIDLRGSNEFKLLASDIKQFCGSERVYYMPNLGNWGDSLIRQGTIDFFKDIDVEVVEVSWVNKKSLLQCLWRRGILIYGGGGAWAKSCSVAPRILSRVKFMFKRMMVLPSTFELPPSSAKKFYARDLYQSRVNIDSDLFAHDMAFYINPNAFDGLVAVRKGACSVFRTDNESKENVFRPLVGEDLGDISALGGHLTDVKDFFSKLAPYEEVYTDRLHVAIAGCLLGMKVSVFGNSYFKIEAIFKSSIEPYYPRCVLCNQSET